LKLVHKFRFCLGRHIKALAGFNSLSAAEKRIKTLVDAGYLSRKKYMYGVSYLYTLPRKAKILLGASKREDKIRIDRIAHDIYVLDAVFYFIVKYGVFLSDIESEKELHIIDGFGGRKHHPDFVIKLGNEKVAVEIELNPKTKTRMEKNIRDNYLNFDRQVWLTDDRKVISMLEQFSSEYAKLEIVRLEGGD